MVEASGQRIAQEARKGLEDAPRAQPARTRCAYVLRAAASLMALCACAIEVGCTAGTQPTLRLTIVVMSAPFAKVESAAVAESTVHWTDLDPTDDDACTESYAAVELGRLMARCPGMESRDIVLSAADHLPATGAYAFLERLGVRFQGPADSETVFPRDPVMMLARLDVASSPAFEFRGLGGTR